MKRLLFVCFFLFCFFTVRAQDWRYMKGKKLVTSLAEALKNPREVYNLYLDGHELYKKDFSGIRNMINLHYLALEDAELDHLPDGLFDQLKNLKTLSLVKNAFKKMPVQIRKLKKLEYLVMYDNEIDSLPDWIGELTQLDNLILPRNKLVYISPAIGKLSKLNYLSLDDNQIPEIPVECGNLISLDYFSLSNNQLKEIPESIGNLKAMHYLSLNGNRLTGIPDETGNARQIENLYLGQNPLLHLPGSLKQLTRLKQLDLEDDSLLVIPDNLPMPDSLESLTLNHVKLNHLPAFLQHCFQLERMELMHTGLSSLPAWLSRLKKMTWLLLDENHFTVFPEVLCQLPELEILRLSDNQLDSISDCIFFLPHLSGFSVSGNPVRHLPASLAKADKLEWIGLTETMIPYPECSYWRKRLKKSVNMSFDSPYFLEDEDVVCCQVDPSLPGAKTFSSFSDNAHFKGGQRLFDEWLNRELDSSLQRLLSVRPDSVWTDSVTVQFIVLRHGGIRNLSFPGIPDPVLKTETERFMKLSCRYWVPPMTGGFQVTGHAQQVFVFTGVKTENGEYKIQVRAHDPSPSIIRELILEE